MVEWRKDNHVEFNNAKDEAITIRRKRNPELKKRIAEARFAVRGQKMRINTEATR